MKEMNLKVYAFPPSPYSRGLLFFLEHSGIPYDLVTVNLRRGENKSDKYQSISPTQKTPAITLGEFALGETSTILRYLSEKYCKRAYYPEQLEQKAKVDFWMEFVCQNVIPFSRELVWQRHLFPAVGRQQSKDLEDRAAQTLRRNLLILNAQMETSEFVSGPDISLADFLLMPSIEWYADANIKLSEFKCIEYWFERMKSESSWHRVEGILKDFFDNQNLSNLEFEYAR